MKKKEIGDLYLSKYKVNKMVELEIPNQFENKINNFEMTNINIAQNEIKKLTKNNNEAILEDSFLD